MCKRLLVPGFQPWFNLWSIPVHFVSNAHDLSLLRLACLKQNGLFLCLLQFLFYFFGVLEKYTKAKPAFLLKSFLFHFWTFFKVGSFLFLFLLLRFLLSGRTTKVKKLTGKKRQVYAVQAQFLEYGYESLIKRASCVIHSGYSLEHGYPANREHSRRSPISNYRCSFQTKFNSAGNSIIWQVCAIVGCC